MSRVKGVELLRALKRGEGSITPYDQTLLHEMVSDLRTGVGGGGSAEQPQRLSETDEVASAAARQREMCCAWAYLDRRCQLLRHAYWDLGAAIPEELRANLSREECSYFSAYSRLASDLMAAHGVDLSGDLQSPPTVDPFIEVRSALPGRPPNVEVFTESGSVTLDPSTVQLVRKSPTVESLIRQGVLEHVQ